MLLRQALASELAHSLTEPGQDSLSGRFLFLILVLQDSFLSALQNACPTLFPPPGRLPWKAQMTQPADPTRPVQVQSGKT